ncbi:MAG: pyridoxal phosphate-dependent aminotransferase family protein [Daejeonella sp.]
MDNITSFISKRLADREGENSLRILKPENNLIDFCSNDYLGFSRSNELKRIIEAELQNYPDYKLGSSGSRLLAGNDQFTEDLETTIAKFHQAETALIFNSGYDANLGLFSALLQRGDTIITDELIHASIIDGVRLSHANRFILKHNDLNSLENKLKLAKGNIFIAVESIYSMDGDEAPLTEICNLSKKYNAAVIVDEAHATGIFGNSGNGLVCELGLQDEVFARTITFGKALGTHGAAVLGSKELRSYLINFARSFIYTTASSFTTHLATKMAYTFLQSVNHQTGIRERINCFRNGLTIGNRLIKSRSAIQAILFPGNKEVRNAALTLQNEGFDVRPIVSPTVPAGLERLRICLHNHNSISEIRSLAKGLNKLT